MQGSTSRILIHVGLLLSALAGASLLWFAMIAPPPFADEPMPPASTTAAVGPPRIIVAFRNDDITAFSDPAQESTILAAFRKHGVRQTFSVIPNPGGLPESEAEKNLRTAPILDSLLRWHANGDIDFALHGYTHRRRPRSAGEFDDLPLSEQVDRLRRGKQLLDRCLKTDVHMFAPPWNQADDNTIAACVSVGISQFCGYRGATPTHGATLINTNAVLFPDTNYEESGHELPSLEKVLPYARCANGTVFVLVFYHSRRDFANPGRFAELDRLLTLLTRDSLVTIDQLDDVAKSFPEQLSAYNIAGLNLLQMQEAEHTAKLTSMPLCWIAGRIGQQCPMDSTREMALDRYYRGDYQHVSTLAREVIRMYERQQQLGRFCFAFVLGVIAFAIARRKDFPKTGRVSAAARIAPFVCALLAIVVIVAVTITGVFSHSRAADLIILGSMVAVAFLLGGFAQLARRQRS